MQGLHLTLGLTGLTLLSLSACHKEASVAPAATPAAVAQQEGIVLNDTVMRLAPTDQAFVPHPLGGPDPVTNWVGRMSRGMHARIVQLHGDWSEVRQSNGAEGWVLSQDMLPAGGISDATLLAATTSYYPAADRTASQGTLGQGAVLLYRSLGADMTEVHVENIGWTWVNTRSLSRDPHDLAVAYLLVQARQAIALKDMDEASELLDQARLKHSNSSLVNLLAEQLDFVFLHPQPHNRTSGHVANVPALAADIP